MSSSKAHSHTEPREAPPVYRCDNNHWHFHPNKYDHSIDYYPWYLWRTEDEDRKFASGYGPIYVQGCGDEQFKVDDNYVCGFYDMNDSRDQKQWCKGRYPKSGQLARKVYREEELSKTPWPSKVRGAPPAYEEASSSQRPGERDDNGGPPNT